MTIVILIGWLDNQYVVLLNIHSIPTLVRLPAVRRAKTMIGQMTLMISSSVVLCVCVCVCFVSEVPYTQIYMKSTARLPIQLFLETC